MIEFENEIFIAVPVERAFAFIADFRNVPKWNYYVRSVDQVSVGDVGEGTIYDQVRLTDAQRFRIVEHHPPGRVTIATEPGSTPAFEMRFELWSTAGGTLLADAWRLESGRSRVLETLAAGQIKRAALANLTKLKTLLETGRVRLQDGREQLY